MANLGHRLSDETVGNILRRHDIPPAPKRKKTSWKDFIRAHMAVMVGTDFFTVEVLTLKLSHDATAGLVGYLHGKELIETGVGFRIRLTPKGKAHVEVLLSK